MDNEVTYEYYIRSDQDGYGMGPWNKVNRSVAETFLSNEYIDGYRKLAYELERNHHPEYIIDAPLRRGRLVGQVKVVRHVPVARLRNALIKARNIITEALS